MDGFARRLLDQHPSLAEFIDLTEADAQADLLATAGLGAVNDAVLRAHNLSVLVDRVAEHTVGAMLVRRGFFALQYEPPEQAKPVDFMGRFDGRRYWIEVKRLGASQHDVLHSTVMASLNEALASDSQPVTIHMELTELFASTQTNDLVRHVKATLRRGAATGMFTFPTDAEWTARYELHAAPARRSPHVSMLGDVLDELLDVTGVDQDRVRHRIQDAYPKFAAKPEEDFAVVVVQVDRTLHLSVVGDALYGREHFDFHVGSDEMTLGRTPNGLFSRGKFSRLAAVIVARRRAHRLFAPYDLVLCPHPAVFASLREIGTALGVDEVLPPHRFP